MRNKLLSLMLMMVLAIPISFGLAGVTACADDGDYIEIRTAEDLYNIRNDLNANYKLMNDLDLTEETSEGGVYDNGGQGWEPIGPTSNVTFSGIFDGGGHTISGVVVKTNLSTSGGCISGLFGNNSGTIKNLKYCCDKMDFRITSSSSSYVDIGCIAAVNTGTIENCAVTGTISGAATRASSSLGNYYYLYMGGISGSYRQSKQGIVKQCYSNIDFNIRYGSESNRVQINPNGISYGDNVENCYSVNRTLTVVGTAKNSYYTQTSGGASTGYLYNASGTKSVINETQLKNKSTFSSFDFDTVWTIETATDYKYPQLRNNMMDTAKHVDVIEWKSEPTKIEYYTDEDIDPTGGVFRAYYIDDTHEDIEVTKDMLSGYDMNQLGMQTVTVTFREGSLSYDILTSSRPEVKSLTLETMPDKTEFARGTAFDFTGATAKVEYANGKSEIIPIATDECTGGNINQSGTYTITFVKFGKTLTFEVKVVPVKPTGIRIASNPDKTTYIEGQSIDLTGLVVKLDYNNGISETITDYKVGEYTNTVGTKEIDVTYEDFSASFNVEFVEKKLTAIMVTTQPTKAKYVVGEEFDNTGMVVKASFDNGISEEISDYTVSELTDATGWQTLTVSYEGKTTTIKVMVEAKELVSIFVAHMPSKTTYIDGESFDPEGMVVKANYNNVLEEEITDYTLSGTTLNNVGENKITILYEGMTATFNVTVVEKQLVKITVTPPTKTEYIAGEEFDKSGMVVNAVYDNGKSETVTGFTVSGFGDTEEDNVVTVEYGGKASSFIVTIHTPDETWIVTQSPTCTTGGIQELHCSNCGKILKTEELDTLGHNWSEWETVESPNCTDKGSQMRTCSSCNEVEYKDVDPTGHIWDVEYTVDKQPTCTENGTESQHCSECGVINPESIRTIEKLPHELGEWSVTKEATCAVAGVRQRICAYCDYLETEDIPVADHDWSNTYTVDKKATCTADGIQSIHCSVCGEIQEGSEAVLPKTGHKYSAWKTTKAATEIAAGQKTRTCANCGHVEKATIAMLKPTLPAVTIKAPKAAKKAATVKWTKFGKAKQKKIGYFQIQYSLDKSFKTGVKTVTAKKTAASKKITKLTSKKTYYVRIRAYLKSGNKVHVSKWSTVKSVKAK